MSYLDDAEQAIKDGNHGKAQAYALTGILKQLKTETEVEE